ncbi:MAG: GGDEF domain-containing protein [Kineosporiaceae bacterium]
MAGRGGTGDPGSAGRALEVAPLSYRVTAMAAFRVLLVMVLGGLAAAYDQHRPHDGAVVSAYLVLTALLGATVLLRRKTLAVKAFGAGLLIDGVFLQYAHERLGHGPAVDAAIAAFVVAVCLLASFRTGLKLAVWQSLLMVVAWRIEEAGLVPQPSAMLHADRPVMATTDMALLWLTVFTTSAAASINERELRRRRYDAEELQGLAAALLSDDRPPAVTDRLLRFVTDEFGAARAVVTGWSQEGGSAVARLLAVSGSVAANAALQVAPSGSALLTLAASSPEPVLALRLDPRRDPLLAAVLPGARRLAVIGLGAARDTAMQRYLVVEFGAGSWRGGRVERRVLTACTQASAIATLALSRAELVAAAHEAAATDSLTHLANRRAFDATMAALERAWRERSQPFALVLVDIDYFKSVNDRFGHQVGDQVLKAVAAALGACAPAGSMAARYGGEEFALLLPSTTTAEAAMVAERTREAMNGIERPVRISASFGVAAVPEDAEDADTVIRAADAALLRAKAMGRDRVAVAEPAPPVQLPS